jgi:hypothetical protein
VLLYFAISTLLDCITLLQETQSLQGLSASAKITSDFIDEV